MRLNPRASRTPLHIHNQREFGGHAHEESSKEHRLAIFRLRRLSHRGTQAGRVAGNAVGAIRWVVKPYAALPQTQPSGLTELCTNLTTRGLKRDLTTRGLKRSEMEGGVYEYELVHTVGFVCT